MPDFAQQFCDVTPYGRAVTTTLSTRPGCAVLVRGGTLTITQGPSGTLLAVPVA